MRGIIIVLLIIVSVFSVNAKETDAKLKESDTKSQATMMITGSIADQFSGESLVGVEVKIEGTDLKTYTDFDGNFTFENVKPGDYKISTNYISYQKMTQELNLTKSQNKIKIKLQSSD